MQYFIGDHPEEYFHQSHTSDYQRPIKEDKYKISHTDKNKLRLKYPITRLHYKWSSYSILLTFDCALIQRNVFT